MGTKASRWLIAAVAVVAVAAAAWVGIARGGGPSALPPPPAPTRVLIAYANPPPLNLKGPLTPSRVMVSQADGGKPVYLGLGDFPLLSPNGLWVVYVAPNDRHSTLKLMPSSGGRARTLGRDSYPFAWSQDSTEVAMGNIGADPVRVFDLTTGRSTTLRLPEGSSSLSFAPDGQSLAYQHSTGRGIDIFSVEIATGKITQLTDDHHSLAPLWGPGGLAFERGLRYGDLWLLPDGHGTPSQLTHTRAGIYPAAWSADGSRILAANPATHNGRLWAVDVTSGAARPLTPWIGDLTAQGLSRNGRTVLAAIGCGGAAGPWGTVDTIPFTGGKLHPLVKGPCAASWNS